MLAVILAEIELGPFAIEHPKALLALLIGFALLVWLLVAKGAPPLRAMLKDRETRIEEAQTQVRQALADAERIRNDYAARIERIEIEARQHIEAAVHEAEAARADIIAEAQQSAHGLRRRSEEELGRERARAWIQLRQQIVQITLDAAEQSVRTHTSEAVQRQLIGDFIARAAVASTEGARAPSGGQDISARRPEAGGA